MAKQLTITMNAEVKTTLENASKRIGVSQSSYISQLIMQKEIEYQTARFMKGLTPEQIQKGLEDQMNK
jgi:predicted DNA-binding protein